MKTLVSFIILFVPVTLLIAQDIQLPAPQKEGGMPLMEALNLRQSVRTYSSQTLPPQTLSDLLWAAWGINRADANKRTAPSANNRQATELYCVLPEGVYIYDAAGNSLKFVTAGDHRSATGTQEYVAGAAMNIVYVAKGENAAGWTDAQKNSAGINAAFIAQNVYLFCASEGLGCVVRGSVPGDKLREILQLGNDKAVVLAQSVGYPVK